jgi:hypothetical protein
VVKQDQSESDSDCSKVGWSRCHISDSHHVFSFEDLSSIVFLHLLKNDM